MIKNSISVVILNWNGLHFLENFLPSVVKFSQGAEIIIADNSSTDKSVEFLKKEYPQVRIIQFETNHGFCKGYNLALRQIDSEYYVLLNSDVEVTENWLSPLIREAEKDQTVAVVQPKIKWYAQKDYFEYAGAAGGFIDKYGYPLCRGRVFNELEKDISQYEESSEIFWASGACFFIRSELYHKFGGLDEHFFAHMEEIDLCWTLLNHEYKIIYTPESTVYHVGGGTLPKSNPRKTYLNFRNGLFLMYKNLPDEIRSKRIFVRMFLDGLAAISFLLKFKFADFAAVVRAHVHYYQKRSELIVSDRRVNPLKFNGYYNSSVVIDYFLRKKKKWSDLDLFRNPK